MARATPIVSPTRVEVVRATRRPKTRRAVQAFAVTVSALVVAMVSPLGSPGLVFALATVVLAAGTSALVLRIVERPREMVVRRARHGGEPRGLIH